ncbi:MAG TPA: DUF4272 domain-containing protein [Thermomicrobiales bacterium]|jgi:hypothetical protein
MGGRDDSTDDQEIEINLRPPSEVARRLIALAALCRRAFLESPSGSAELDEAPDAEAFDLVTWLDEHDLARDLTKEERRLLDTPVGALSRDEMRAGTWNAEALLALGWAGGLLPARLDPIAPGDPQPVLGSVPSPWSSPAAWIESFDLRSEEEIAGERERAEVWLWRAEIEDERRHLSGRRLAELETDIRDVVRESVESGILRRGAHDDFPVEGRPFRTLQEDRVDLIATIAAVRLHALNWLCGFGSSWDDVPLAVD